MYLVTLFYNPNQPLGRFYASRLDRKFREIDDVVEVIHEPDGLWPDPLGYREIVVACCVERNSDLLNEAIEYAKLNKLEQLYVLGEPWMEAKHRARGLHRVEFRMTVEQVLGHFSRALLTLDDDSSDE